MIKVMMAPVLMCLTAAAQPGAAPMDPRAIQAAQVEAMKPLAWMDGEWRGPATHKAGAQTYSVTQTERVGPLLGGSVKVVEGRGYMADGSTGFNALAVIHYDPQTRAYSLHSFAEGRKGVFPLTPVAGGGFDWEIKAGPTTIRYQARLKDGQWVEVGDRIVPGQAPVRFHEMTLTRIGASDWPLGKPVSPKP